MTRKTTTSDLRNFIHNLLVYGRYWAIGFRYIIVCWAVPPKFYNFAGSANILSFASGNSSKKPKASKARVHPWRLRTGTSE
jgi:hypothetical protein